MPIDCTLTFVTHLALPARGSALTLGAAPSQCQRRRQMATFQMHRVGLRRSGPRLQAGSRSSFGRNSNSSSSSASRSGSGSRPRSRSRSRSRFENEQRGGGRRLSKKTEPESSERSVHVDLTTEERLQKVLSRLGVASRRQAETLIGDGRVSVNGRQITELGTCVNIYKDRIYVNGIAVTLPTSPIWIAVHKPRGYLSTMAHPKQSKVLTQSAHLNTRASLYRILKDSHIRDFQALVPAGTIEEDASGLVILTNERGAIPPLVRPDNPHVQTWFVDCLGVLSVEQLQKLNSEIFLDGSKGRPLTPVTILLDKGKGHVTSKERAIMTRVEIRVRDSRHRVVRRLCEKVGLSVVRISRKAFGPVLLGSLRAGEFRNLRSKEVKALKRGVSERTVKSWS